jgi:hypothetical protein
MSYSCRLSRSAISARLSAKPRGKATKHAMLHFGFRRSYDMFRLREERPHEIGVSLEARFDIIGEHDIRPLQRPDETTYDGGPVGWVVRVKL